MAPAPAPFHSIDRWTYVLGIKTSTVSASHSRSTPSPQSYDATVWKGVFHCAAQEEYGGGSRDYHLQIQQDTGKGEEQEITLRTRLGYSCWHGPR